MDEVGQLGVTAFVVTFAGDVRCLFESDLLKFAVVNLAHIRKSRPKPLIIRPPKRIDPEAIEMIGDQHQTPGHHVRIKAPGGVREYEIFHTQQTKAPNRKHHLLHVVAFVKMKTPLLHGDRDAIDSPQNKLPGVPNHCRTRKSRYLFIRDSHSVNNSICKRPKPTAKNDRRPDFT